MSKFADADAKLCQRARNPDDITELQEDINKLVEWASKWEMNFNVDKCSVMHIGHNNVQGNYNIFNQQLRKQQINSGIYIVIIITKDLKWQKQTEKSCKRQTEYCCSLPEIPGTKTKNKSSHYIQISSSSTSRICMAILVPTFKTRH